MAAHHARIAGRYFLAAAAYECARAPLVLRDARVRPWRGEEARPLLLGEKLLVGAAAVAMSGALAPVHAVSDLCRLEVWARGWDPARFGVGGSERRDLLDFLW